MQDRFDKAMDPVMRPIQEIMFKAMNEDMDNLIIPPPGISRDGSRVGNYSWSPRQGSANGNEFIFLRTPEAC